MNLRSPKSSNPSTGPQKCPHLVFANPDSLTNRLMNHDAAFALTKDLKNVVFDEIHLLSSVVGAKTAGVIRRLGALVSGGDLMITGCSATVAEPEDHLSKVFGRNRDDVRVVSPEESEMELTGIIHHVFHRGIEGQNFQSNITNLGSLVTHGRRRRQEDVVDIRDTHKTLGFADSHIFLDRGNTNSGTMKVLN